MNRRKNAFTLMELLVVVFIMAAAASVALPNFSRFVRNVEFNTTADDLVSAIRFGQLRALTRGKWVQVKIDPSGYWLEEERFTEDAPLSGSIKPVFERLKNRHGRYSRFPEGMRLKSTESVVVLSPDGRIQSPEIEICRREKCFVIETSQMIGEVRVVKFNEGMPDVRS